MRFSVAAAALLCVSMLPVRAAQADDKRSLPPPGRAQLYPMHETHADERVTIAAEPYDTKEKQSVFRVDYLKRRLMPVRMIVTNDSDKPIHLDQARIYFISKDGDKIKADTEEQADRRMSDIKDPSRGASLPFPLRASGLKTHDKDIHKDFDEADFPSLVVRPGETQSGVLFFDVSDYDQHPLKGAKLYVKQITEDDGGELFYFEVPLSETAGGAASTDKAASPDKVASIDKAASADKAAAPDTPATQDKPAPDPDKH